MEYQSTLRRHPSLGKTIFVPDYEGCTPYGGSMKYPEFGGSWVTITETNFDLLLHGRRPPYLLVSFVVEEFEFHNKKDYFMNVQKWARKKGLNRPWTAKYNHLYGSEKELPGLITDFLTWFLKEYPDNIIVCQAGDNEANMVDQFLNLEVLRQWFGPRKHPN